jgi:hypothetical protein
MGIAVALPALTVIHLVTLQSVLINVVNPRVSHTQAKVILDLLLEIQDPLPVHLVCSLDIVTRLRQVS